MNYLTRKSTYTVCFQSRRIFYRSTYCDCLTCSMEPIRIRRPVFCGCGNFWTRSESNIYLEKSGTGRENPEKLHKNVFRKNPEKFPALKAWFPRISWARAVLPKMRLAGGKFFYVCFVINYQINEFLVFSTAFYFFIPPPLFFRKII